MLIVPGLFQEASLMQGALARPGHWSFDSSTQRPLQAFFNPDTNMLEGGVNPLASFFTVEANDTLIQINSSASYSSLEVHLSSGEIPLKGHAASVTRFL
eukprot:1136818-Pelagomonas_calceolata.AAC.4